MTLESTARQFLGTPFLHQGRDPAVGIDCIGLIVCCFRVLGWPHERHDNPTYGKQPCRGMLQQHLQAAFGDPLPAHQAQPGDILAMRWHREPNHVAIVGLHEQGGLSIIHTSANLGRVVEHGLRGPWVRRVVHVYRPEVSRGR